MTVNIIYKDEKLGCGEFSDVTDVDVTERYVVVMMSGLTSYINWDSVSGFSVEDK